MVKIKKKEIIKVLKQKAKSSIVQEAASIKDDIYYVGVIKGTINVTSNLINQEVLKRLKEKMNEMVSKHPDIIKIMFKNYIVKNKVKTVQELDELYNEVKAYFINNIGLNLNEVETNLMSVRDEILNRLSTVKKPIYSLINFDPTNMASVEDVLLSYIKSINSKLIKKESDISSKTITENLIQLVGGYVSKINGSIKILPSDIKFKEDEITNGPNRNQIRVFISDVVQESIEKYEELTLESFLSLNDVYEEVSSMYKNITISIPILQQDEFVEIALTLLAYVNTLGEIHSFNISKIDKLNLSEDNILEEKKVYALLSMLKMLNPDDDLANKYIKDIPEKIKIRLQDLITTLNSENLNETLNIVDIQRILRTKFAEAIGYQNKNLLDSVISYFVMLEKVVNVNSFNDFHFEEIRKFANEYFETGKELLGEFTNFEFSSSKLFKLINSIDFNTFNIVEFQDYIKDYPKLKELDSLKKHYKELTVKMNKLQKDIQKDEYYLNNNINKIKPEEVNVIKTRINNNKQQLNAFKEDLENTKFKFEQIKKELQEYLSNLSKDYQNLDEFTMKAFKDILEKFDARFYEFIINPLSQNQLKINKVNLKNILMQIKQKFQLSSFDNFLNELYPIDTSNYPNLSGVSIDDMFREKFNNVLKIITDDDIKNYLYPDFSPFHRKYSPLY